MRLWYARCLFDSWSLGKEAQMHCVNRKINQFTFFPYHIGFLRSQLHALDIWLRDLSARPLQLKCALQCSRNSDPMTDQIDFNHIGNMIQIVFVPTLLPRLDPFGMNCALVSLPRQDFNPSLIAVNCMWSTDPALTCSFFTGDNDSPAFLHLAWFQSTRNEEPFEPDYVYARTQSLQLALRSPRYLLTAVSLWALQKVS